VLTTITSVQSSLAKGCIITPCSIKWTRPLHTLATDKPLQGECKQSSAGMIHAQCCTSQCHSPCTWQWAITWHTATVPLSRAEIWTLIWCIIP